MPEPKWQRLRKSFSATFGRSGLACPICFTEFADDRQPTRDHVPPASIGGTWEVPTCAECNHRWGKVEKNLDSYVRRALHNDLPEPGAAGLLSLGGTKVRVKQRRIDGDVVVIRFPKGQTAAERALSRKLTEGLSQAEISHLRDDPGLVFCEPLLERCFLKAGYLALFRTFGYGLVARTLFNPVREQLRRPDNRVFDTLIGPRQSASTDRAIIFKAVLEPVEQRVLIVTFQGFVIRPGDAASVDVNVTLPCPGDGALDSHRRWCETVRSGSKAPVTLLTESDMPWVDGTLGWYPQTEQGAIEVFPPASEDQVTQTRTHTV